MRLLGPNLANFQRLAFSECEEISFIENLDGLTEKGFHTFNFRVASYMIVQASLALEEHQHLSLVWSEESHRGKFLDRDVRLKLKAVEFKTSPISGGDPALFETNVADVLSYRCLWTPQEVIDATLTPLGFYSGEIRSKKMDALKRGGPYGPFA